MDNDNTLRRLCEVSDARLPLRDESDVSAAFSHECEGGAPSVQWFADRLRDLLIVPDATDLHVWDIRKAAAGFALERAIEQSVQTWDATLNAIASCIPGDANLRQFDDPAWEKAIDIGRALSVLNIFPFENARVLAVAAGGQRLHKLGYRLTAPMLIINLRKEKSNGLRREYALCSQSSDRSAFLPICLICSSGSIRLILKCIFLDGNTGQGSASARRLSHLDS